MLSTRIFSLACAVAVFGCLTAAAASAQPVDKRTLFTFSGSVALPGVTLPAGQYLFTLANPSSSRNIVQVLNADGTKPYGLFFTIAAERPEPASAPEVRFMETASGMPAAIRTWWYPGERTGYEFIFPKEQARRLAMSASQPVLTTQAQTTTTEQTNTADLSRVASGGQETHVDGSAAPTAATPTGGTHEGQLASSAISIPIPEIPVAGSGPAATATGSPQAARTQLPGTASQLPLVATVATLALFSAATINYWRRRPR